VTRRLAAALATCAAFPAHAHLVTTGVGPFYDGAAHFFLSFEELLPVLALALLAGLRGARYGRWLIALLPLAWLAGAAVASAFPPASELALVTTALLIVPGVLAALDRAWPLWLVAVLASLYGTWAGFTNGAAMSAAGLGARGVVGAASMALVVAVLGAALVLSLRGAGLRIAARVAGSWLAALGLLSVGWALKG
jgi:hydrogenase/urease accessory protein HupE